MPAHVVGSTGLTFTQHLSFGFEQGVSGTSRELAGAGPVPKNLPLAFGDCHLAAPSSCTLLLYIDLGFVEEGLGGKSNWLFSLVLYPVQATRISPRRWGVCGAVFVLGGLFHFWDSVLCLTILTLLILLSVGDKGSGSFLFPMAECFPSLESSSPIIYKKREKQIKGKQSFGVISQGKSPDSTV